ncbi:MAG TPA: SMP-30/gluconolactonase/LRE family protein [Candidatus Angelobacter sp.]|nr:SMP-30/gluconolactonase/LRE family protein [Candidatus Angelobacter sp.]
MKFTTRSLLPLILFALMLSPATSLFGQQNSDRAAAEIFAVLPDGSTGPEGLTLGPDGNVYVATFGFNQNGAVSGLGQLFVFDPEGRLIRQVGIANSSPHLLGLAFHPMTGALLVIDFGAGQVLNVNPVSGASSVFMTVTGSSGLNALTFDAAGNVYVSDSFQGIIWKTGSGGGPGTAWVTDPLLSTTGIPPFGANGVEFNSSGNTLFVANTGNDTIVQIPVSNGTAGKPSVFVNSINGADGIAIDTHDNLWVAANQSDEIVVVSPGGKLIAKLGDFEGVDAHGLPHGLLFPASPAFSQNGDFLYVTNLALDLRVFGLPQAVDSQWCAQVRHFTVSRVRTHFRPLK